MIRYCTSISKWRFGYEVIRSEELQKNAHWLVLGPIAICVWFR
jgi:hypothetical protein